VDANGNGLRLHARYGQNGWAIAVGRRNYLFAGSAGGGRRAALVYSLIETCKLNGVDPYAYLKDVFTQLPTLPAREFDTLLPWCWRPRP
jgi:transposase